MYILCPSWHVKVKLSELLMPAQYLNDFGSGWCELAHKPFSDQSSQIVSAFPCCAEISVCRGRGMGGGGGGELARKSNNYRSNSYKCHLIGQK